MIHTYIKKPVEVQAVQWTGGENTDEVMAFIGDAATLRAGYIYIETLEGEMLANVYDYIIRGIQGEHYPCKPDIFEATYEPLRTR